MDIVLFAALVVAVYGIMLTASLMGRDAIMIMLGIMCTISMLFATKIVNIGGYPLVPSAPMLGLIFYSGTILQEFFSARDARKVLWINLAAMFGLVALGTLVYYMPLHDDADMLGQSYDQIFAFFPKALLGGLIAFSTSYGLNMLVASGLHRLTGDRFFPVRSFVTVAISNLWDIAVFITIAYPITESTPHMIGMTWGMRLLCFIAGVPVLWIIKHLYHKRGYGVVPI
jgi:uncharacterized integral membrane protein (TIGR00697 family)